MLGAGMLSFGTTLVDGPQELEMLAQRSCDRGAGRPTTFGNAISLRTAPVSFSNGRSCVPALTTPPISQRKSMCQLVRRISPSVTHRKPTSSCRLTACRIASSSSRRSSSGRQRARSEPPCAPRAATSDAAGCRRARREMGDACGWTKSFFGRSSVEIGGAGCAVRLSLRRAAGSEGC